MKDEETLVVVHILEVIRQKELAAPTTRAIHQALKDRRAFSRAASLEPGFEYLVHAGYLKLRPQPHRPGRPSRIFDVSPRVWGNEGSRAREERDA